MIDEYYKNVHKTSETMKEVIKIQSERLKVLNKEVRELKAEKKRTYKEMVYFRNKSRRNQGKIKKAIEYIEEKGRLKYNPNELIDILKGEVK